MNLTDVANAFSSYIVNILGIKISDEISSTNLASWNEALQNVYGSESPTKPRLLDIALFGDTRLFMKSDITDEGSVLEKLKAIQPLTPRLYSISVIQSNDKGIAEYIYLNIRYWHDGVASRLLINSEPGTSIQFRVHHHDKLQRKEARTIYFASGTGISPFTNSYSDNTFIHDQWLIWMTTEISKDVRSDFKFVCRYNQRLTINVIETKKAEQKCENILSNFQVVNTNAPRGQRLLSLMEEENSWEKKLKQWLDDDVMIYVCGNIGFVIEVVNLLIDSGAMIDDLVAEGFLRVECFGSPSWMPSMKKIIPPWTILRSSVPFQTRDDIPLMVIGNGVYKLSKTLLDLHPGGKDMILLYQGSDATKPFIQVGHDKDGSAMGMLQAFEVGEFNASHFAFDDIAIGKDFDPIRIAFDCAEMRNSFLIEESVLFDREGIFRQSEFNQAEALKTHRRVLFQHFPRFLKIVQTVCQCLMSEAEWETSLDEIEVSETLHDTITFAKDWNIVLLNHRYFFVDNVLSAARLLEALASNISLNELQQILESWRKVVFCHYYEFGSNCEC